MSCSRELRPAARWAIVLAGGDGVRLRPYVHARFGDLRPKQYCAFSGSRSMLQHTLDRAEQLAAPERIVTVVAAQHAPWSQAQLAGRRGAVVVQPANRETAPGLYLPLAWIRARAPGAVVYVLPSDHYVRPEARFVEAIAAAGDAAAAHPDRVVLTGIPAERPTPELGYVEPADALDAAGQLRGVARFLEKPSPEQAAAAIARGACWNTMVMAATVDALWGAARATIPTVLARFERLQPALLGPHAEAATAAVYEDMPCASFSREVVARAPERCALAVLEGVEWSDWGVAEQIEATLARLVPPAAPGRDAGRDLQPR
jgi:mannose-1-phosphate guanylyltransferase